MLVLQVQMLHFYYILVVSYFPSIKLFMIDDIYNLYPYTIIVNSEKLIY